MTTTTRRVGNVRACAIAALVLAAFSVGTARAVPITFAFQGVVDLCNFCGAVGLEGVGFAGSYTFDSQAIDETPSDPSSGRYVSAGAPFGMHFDFGPYRTVGDSVAITVVNDQFFAGPTPPVRRDAYLASSQSVGFISLGDCSGNALGDKSLPTAPPDLGAFSDIGCGIFLEPVAFLVEVSPDLRSQVLGHLTSLTAGAIPEPATLSLLALALAACGGFQRWPRTGRGFRRTRAKP